MDKIVEEILIVQKEVSKNKSFDDKQTHADWVTDIITVLGDISIRSSLVDAAAIILIALETYDRNNGFKPAHWGKHDNKE